MALRNDSEFRLGSYPDHHIGKSPLESLPINMIYSFPLDYMHLVLLGVTRKLLHMWVSVVPFKLSNASKEVVTKNLAQCRKFLPLEFNRKPDNFRDSERWKASECRTFLLYVGLLSVQSELPKDRWKHFCLLSIAIRILCSNSYSGDPDLVDYAETLLKKFVVDFALIYKNVSIVYNLHSLLHLSDDVRRLGSLDSFSAFNFENFLGIMKRRIRSGSHPLAQISRRLSEVSGCTLSEKSFKKNKKITVINKLNIIIGDMKNSCVLLKDDSVGLIVKQSRDRLFVKKFVRKFSLLKKPVDTSFLNMYRVSHKTKTVAVDKNYIQAKCFICPYSGEYAIIPLL